MKSCNCGRSAPGSTTCLVLFDRKENGAEKKTTEVLGAVETVCCDACLVRYARKSILKSILGFIAGVIVISLLAGLINRVFRLSWVGGGLLIFALLGNLIRSEILHRQSGRHKKTRLHTKPMTVTESRGAFLQGTSFI